MLLLVLPAGLVAREVGLALLLADSLPKSAVLAAVVLSRFIVTMSDVVAAGIGWGYARSHRLLADKAVGRA